MVDVREINETSLEISGWNVRGLKKGLRNTT